MHDYGQIAIHTGFRNGNFGIMVQGKADHRSWLSGISGVDSHGTGTVRPPLAPSSAPSS